MPAPMYTPRGPTGFGRDIIFGSMGRTTEPMRANISITNNRRNRSANGYGMRSKMFNRARHTEGQGFFDTILNIGKKVLPAIGKMFTSSPIGSVISKLIPQIPEILERASGNSDVDPMIRKLLEITQDPEIKRLIEELTNSSSGYTTTTYT